ncbi:hypothetical protein GA0061078_0051 [Bifidobacterium bohemicum]|uniref:Lipoprotein n=1 Tax=Bifidobacterium bohemicum DSM 22767 TaxID=1437606 RepID=A0A086ZE00_9BIFI|nr:hypothetical protein [Bifidobacterium bohemicum]KFI44750.1 hypothetical protein BBOH_1476 [Bifidobacterium bohemicum DSM 22767]SCC18804.1 hypothetical protein GA0061078_0051 [Bifidobacterium bohemicum]
MRLKRYMAGLLATCMLVPACAGCGSAVSSPKQAAQTLLDAMSKGEVDTVRKYTYLDKKGELSNAKPTQGITDVQVGDEAKTDTTGSVNVKFKVAGKQENLTLGLRKDAESDQWKADGKELFVEVGPQDNHHFLGGRHLNEMRDNMLLPGVYKAEYHGGWYSGTWKENVTELGKSHGLDVRNHEQDLEANDGIKTDTKVRKALDRSLMHLGGCGVLDDKMDPKHPYFGKNKDISGACRDAGNGITDTGKTIIASYAKHPDKEGNFLLTLGGTATGAKGNFIAGNIFNPPTGYQCEELGPTNTQCVKFSATPVDMTGIQVTLNRYKMEAEPADAVEERIGEFLYAGHGQREGMPD